MKSLNDVLWNKDGKTGEEGVSTYGTFNPKPPMISDSCACSNGCPNSDAGFYQGQKACAI